MGNTRAFFDEYANEKGFDPLSVEGWYSISLLDLQSKKVGSQFSQFPSSLSLSLYPQLLTLLSIA